MHRYIQSFSSPTIKGWLMKKARTGLRKTWIRRYFVLESQQLRCYKSNQDDAPPISSFDLREYQLQTRSSSKPFTFQLIHQNSKSSSTAPMSPSLPSLDLYLQAGNEKEWGNWVDTLERHVGDQQHLMMNASSESHDYYFDHYDNDRVDVLDKWLERYDLIVPRADRCTSSLLSLAPSSNYDVDVDEDEVDDNDDSDLQDMSRQQHQQLTNPPRSPVTEKLPQAINPSASTSSTSSDPKSSSSRFWVFSGQSDQKLLLPLILPPPPLLLPLLVVVSIDIIGLSCGKRAKKKFVAP
ncbi:hypothetical protein BCR42DRAFT_446042 [Absidia repens]|uniref:PH domain-containing protein n=1 Tax=Absidia repens TaxID=90262 RepID=A0A1X2IXM4_9FUNG|nr:hypothetical protein BCR42DRAFT_446042 [Absidia repens]